jgi:hypothetical protein
MHSLKWRLSKTADHFARHATEDTTIAFLIAFEQVLGLLQRNQNPALSKRKVCAATLPKNCPTQRYPCSQVSAFATASTTAVGCKHPRATASRFSRFATSFCFDVECAE